MSTEPEVKFSNNFSPGCGTATHSESLKLNIFVCKLWFFYVYFYRVSLLSSERRFLLTVIVVPVEADVAGHGGWSGGHRVYGGCS